MNFLLKIILIVVGIKVIVNGINMIFFPEIEYFMRGVCLNCHNKLYGIILGYISILVGIIIFYLILKKKKIEYSKCPNCKETYTYSKLEDGMCPKCNKKTIDMEKYYDKK